MNLSKSHKKYYYLLLIQFWNDFPQSSEIEKINIHPVDVDWGKFIKLGQNSINV